MDEITLGREYEFIPINPKQPINGGKPSAPFFAKAIGWVRLPRECPRDLCLQVEEWRDGYPVDRGRAITAVNMDYWTARPVN